MSELLSPALSGAVAGLGVAMPMGAMSVLLLREAIRNRRTAVAAAAGVAAVDFGYAALATALGPWVAAHVAPVEAWIRLAAAAVLLSLAARGLHSAAPAAPAPRPPTPDSATAPARPPARPAPGTHPQHPDPAAGAAGPEDDTGAGAAGAGRQPGGFAAGPERATATARRASRRPAGAAPGGRPGKAFLAYMALTAVNPTTALYFAALTTAQATSLRSSPAGAAFAVGAGAASLLWQQALVALGSFAGRRVSATARAWTFRLGYGLVIAYAVKIAFPLPRP